MVLYIRKSIKLFIVVNQHHVLITSPGFNNLHLEVNALILHLDVVIFRLIGIKLLVVGKDLILLSGLCVSIIGMSVTGKMCGVKPEKGFDCYERVFLHAFEIGFEYSADYFY